MFPLNLIRIYFAIQIALNKNKIPLQDIVNYKS